MTSPRRPFRKPQPYPRREHREQKTTTEYTSYLHVPDGEDVFPSITVTTPDTRGNRELRRQTMRMGRGVSRDASGRDMLPLPSRGFTSIQRQADGQHAQLLQRERPSYVQRLSQSQPPPEARSLTEDEGRGGVHGDGQVRRTASVLPAEADTPEKEGEVQDNRRSFKLPLRPARISAGERLSEEMAKLSLQAPEKDQESRSVERGRRTTKGDQPRKSSSSDSDSWKHRGRSRGPRPKPEVKVEVEVGE